MLGKFSLGFVCNDIFDFLKFDVYFFVWYFFNFCFNLLKGFVVVNLILLMFIEWVKFIIFFFSLLFISFVIFLKLYMLF